MVVVAVAVVCCMFGSNDSEQSQAESFRDTTGHSSLNHDGMMIGWTDD